MLPILVLIIIIYNYNRNLYYNFLYNMLICYYLYYKDKNNCESNIINNKKPIENNPKKHNNNSKKNKKKTNNSISPTNNNLSKESDKNYKNFNNKLNKIPKKILCNIPLVLGEYILEIPLEHNIKFEEQVLKIRNIKNDIWIKEYTILFENSPTYLTYKNKYHIFLKGFLARNIEYSCIENIDNHCIKTNIKELIEEIPFESTFYIYSKFKSNKPNSNVKLYLKKATVYDTNSFINSQSTLPKSFHNKYSIENLHSKIILKLQINLTKEEQVYI